MTCAFVEDVQAAGLGQLLSHLDLRWLLEFRRCSCRAEATSGRQLLMRLRATRSKSLRCNLHRIGWSAVTQQWKQQLVDEAVSCKVSFRRGCQRARASANSVPSPAGLLSATNPSPAESPSQKLPGQRYVFRLGRPEFSWRTLPASSLGDGISTRAA